MANARLHANLLAKHLAQLEIRDVKEKRIANNKKAKSFAHKKMEDQLFIGPLLIL